MTGSSRPRDGDSPRTTNSTATDASASRASRSKRRPPERRSPRGRAPERHPPEERSKPVLRLEIVGDDDCPDRATAYPPGLTGIERMETWLSVNASVVVDLSARR